LRDAAAAAAAEAKAKANADAAVGAVADWLSTTAEKFSFDRTRRLRRSETTIRTTHRGAAARRRRTSKMVSTRSAQKAEDDSLHVAAPFAHLALALLTVAPLFTAVNTNLNVLLTASLAVYAGAHRSVRPAASGLTEAMSKQDAMRFPIVGSCVLLGFFILFKYLPADLINKLMTGYFLLLGVAALTGALAPVLGLCMPRALAVKRLNFGTIPTIKFITDEPTRLSLTVAELVAGVVSVAFSLWYVMKKHWIANNALGLAFSLTGIEFLTLESVQIGTILLVGLFFYDIFWVFCTPVMVSVAKSFDAPIKLLFPKGFVVDAKQQFSMLGLGDIVIPGIYVALILRMDIALRAAAKKARRPKPRSYFPAVAFGYVAGLGTTILVMNVFNAAQPALLYIVPGILGGTFTRALFAGGLKELGEVWRYGDEEDEEGESTKSK
jgi:minor histocompatibility antigen H13